MHFLIYFNDVLTHKGNLFPQGFCCSSTFLVTRIIVVQHDDFEVYSNAAFGVTTLKSLTANKYRCFKTRI